MLFEANDEWQTQHRYMQTEPMAELMAPIINVEHVLDCHRGRMTVDHLSYTPISITLTDVTVCR